MNNRMDLRGGYFTVEVAIEVSDDDMEKVIDSLIREITHDNEDLEREPAYLSIETNCVSTMIDANNKIREAIYQDVRERILDGRCETCCGSGEHPDTSETCPDCEGVGYQTKEND